ncbi:hypothetical protein FCM35_KLT00131 [Carex littledalei]|uniref:TNase-like domain-containing protein n=1 Tax=Carex littledalei TaxID=544730 RepID=A0A833RKB2_9POAL|nr:hypothetical protein FCM35_KLT00131 [Carex littledalei]
MGNAIFRCFNGDNKHLPVPPHWPSIVSRHQFASPAASDHSNLELHPQNYESTYQSFLPFYSLPFSPIQSQVPGPSSRSNGVQFELQTLPVKSKLVSDGDGMTVHVNAADPRESATVPIVVQEAAIERNQARAIRDYARADALYKFIVNCGYRVVIINNEEILAREYRIRLRGIDAPEMNMEYGQEAKDELTKLIQQKPLTIHVYGKDPYDRLVGDVYVDGIFVQERLLREGCAWHYEAYDKRPAFAQWQKEARNEGRGLWANPNPVEPWEFKKMERIRKNAERPYQNSGNAQRNQRVPILPKPLGFLPRHHQGQEGTFSLGRASRVKTPAPILPWQHHAHHMPPRTHTSTILVLSPPLRYLPIVSLEFLPNSRITEYPLR